MKHHSPNPNGPFKCLHCRHQVDTSPVLSGVQNRNHCPYCLWSRHVDLNQAGDRLAACLASMRPIGLTVKKTHKKYARFEQGELMLVHLCAECGKVSINRIAADDNDQVMLEIFRESPDLEPPLLDRLAEQGIRLLGPDDLPLVHRQLYGSRPAPN